MQSLLPSFPHWPCVYSSPIGPMVAANVRLTTECRDRSGPHLSIRLLSAVLTGDGALLAPLPENLSPVYLITAGTMKIFVYATRDDNEENAVPFMMRSHQMRQAQDAEVASHDHSGVVQLRT